MSVDNRYPGEPNVPPIVQARLDKLTRENRSLQETNQSLRIQLEQIKKEQIVYLQNVSHQIVAPLHAMKMHIENLRYGRIKSAERIRKVLRSIYSQATISVHLAKNFALMSNLEADQTLAAQREPLELIDMKGLMVNLADDFQPSGWDRNIPITVTDVPLESAPRVLAIKNLISQVFSNIIENAIKYSNSDTTIEIDGEYEPRDDTVTVRIANQGIPLIPAQMELLFTRGYRSLGAKNAYPAGTGFGLFIAKRIIDIHEGSITAYTDNDSWTVFEVTLSVKGLTGKTVQIGPKDHTNS